MFSQVPGKARFACTGLVVMSSILLALVAIMGVFLVSTSNSPDLVGIVIITALGAYFVLLALGGILAAVLLSKRKPAGRILAWIVVPFFLVNNMLFLIVAVFVIQSLVSTDMRDYLSQRDNSDGDLKDGVIEANVA